MARGWRWFTNGGIEKSPFTFRHCVPLAFANVSTVRSKAKFAVLLADAARVKVWDHDDSRTLLTPNGGAPFGSYPQWCELARYRIVENYRPEPRFTEVAYTDGWGEHRWRSRSLTPTLAQFARTTGRRGRWIVYTNRHAQAVVNGKIRGWASPRQRVVRAIRIEEV